MVNQTYEKVNRTQHFGTRGIPLATYKSVSIEQATAVQHDLVHVVCMWCECGVHDLCVFVNATLAHKQTFNPKDYAKTTGFFKILQQFVCTGRGEVR